MTNGIRAMMVLALLAFATACGGGAQTVPTSPTPPTTAAQPRVVGITPNVGSDRGGSWGTVTGTDFRGGATVMLGTLRMPTFFVDSTSIRFSTTSAHASGTVDVVVTNPGGLSGTLSRGYTFASPTSFDFNGDWIAHAGSEYEIDMRVTIRQNRVVGLSCDGLAVALSSTAEVRDAGFLLGGEVTMTGTLVSPVNAVGTIDVPPCATRWWADKAPD